MKVSFAARFGHSLFTVNEHLFTNEQVPTPFHLTQFSHLPQPTIGHSPFTVNEHLFTNEQVPTPSHLTRFSHPLRPMVSLGHSRLAISEEAPSTHVLPKVHLTPLVRIYLHMHTNKHIMAILHVFTNCSTTWPYYIVHLVLRKLLLDLPIRTRLVTQ